MGQYLPLKNNNRPFSPLLSGLEIGLPPGQTVPEPHQRNNYIDKPLPKPPIRLPDGLEVAMGRAETGIPPPPMLSTETKPASKGSSRKIAQLTGEAGARAGTTSLGSKKIQQLTGYDLDIARLGQQIKDSDNISLSSSSVYSHRSESPVELAGDSLDPLKTWESWSPTNQVISPLAKDKEPLYLKKDAYNASVTTGESKSYATEVYSSLRHTDRQHKSSAEDATWATPYVGFTTPSSANNDRNRVEQDAFTYENIYHTDGDVSPKQQYPSQPLDDYHETMKALIPKALSLRPKTVDSNESRSESRFSDHSSDDERSLASQVRDRVLRGLASPFKSSSRASRLFHDSHLDGNISIPSLKSTTSIEGSKSFSAGAQPLRPRHPHTSQPHTRPFSPLPPQQRLHSPAPPSSTSTPTFVRRLSDVIKTFSAPTTPHATNSPAKTTSNRPPSLFSPFPHSPHGPLRPTSNPNLHPAKTRSPVPPSSPTKPTPLTPTSHPLISTYPNPNPFSPFPNPHSHLPTPPLPSPPHSPSPLTSPTNPTFARRLSDAIRNFGATSPTLPALDFEPKIEAGREREREREKGRHGFMARVVEREGELVAEIGDVLGRVKGKVREVGMGWEERREERRRQGLKGRIVVVGRGEVGGVDGGGRGWV